MNYANAVRQSTQTTHEAILSQPNDKRPLVVRIPQSDKQPPEENVFFKSGGQKDEQQYILTLETDQQLHERLNALRQKYFPVRINKLSAHLTLFHALPESRLDNDIIPVIQSLADKTEAFDIHAGRAFRLSKGIGITVPKHQGGDKSRAVHEALQTPWRKAGFLSPQDDGGVRVHWTIMNKVNDEKYIQKSFDEVESSWEQPWGVVVGLKLWREEQATAFDAILESCHPHVNTATKHKVADSVIAPSTSRFNGTRMPVLTRTSTPEQTTSRRTLIRQASNTLLRSLSSRESMASVAMPLQAPRTTLREEQVMDTRTPSPMPPPTNTSAATMEYKPDLSQEVAMLSTKLVNAINFQTTLDDQVQQTRHELEMSQRQFAKLQAEKKYLDDMIKDGILVRKSEMDPVVASAKAELHAERVAREAAEKSKKQTEAELESLTSALFEEANEMVSVARKDSEAAEKRNSQLKSKLNDTEVLLASQQEQLQDLKLTMERMSERGDNDIARNSVPSTPIQPPSGLFEGLPMSSALEIPPEHPLFFSSLLVPVLRSDVTAYNDFQELLIAARKAAGHLRSSSSGNPPGGSGTNSLGQVGQFSGSSPNLPGAFSFSTSSSPHTSQSFSPPLMPLKDTKFYRRTLVEDIEPTLRLDLAPGLSFLSRRGVLSSLLQGSLIVEPFNAGSKFVGPIYACALCGEGRTHEHYHRKHRFKTSEDESAQRYPLCDYCLGRIRASGDFITFLRMVRDGHWRADTEDEQKGAWEESVRLRERMFWARMGGGVIPAAMKHTTPSTTAVKSPRESEDSLSNTKTNGLTPLSQEEVEPAQEKKAVDQKLVEVFHRHKKTMSFSGGLPELDGTSRSQPSAVKEAPIAVKEKGPHVSEDPGASSREQHEPPEEATRTTGVVESKAGETSSNTPIIAAPEPRVGRPPATIDRPASSRTSSATSKSPDRKQSGVLARVRAMEAQQQSK